MVTSRPWPNPLRTQRPIQRRRPKRPARPSHARGGLEGILGKAICSVIDRVARARSLGSLARTLRGEYFGLPPPGTNDYLAAQAFMTHTGGSGFCPGSRVRIKGFRKIALTMGP